MMFKNIVVLFFSFLIYFSASAQNTMIRTSEDKDFRKGLELLEREKYGAAREFFTRYIETNKDHLKAIDAEYYIAYSAMNLFHPDAEILFDNFIRKYPFHSKASEAYYDLGTFYYNNKKYDKAIGYLEKVNLSHLSAEQKTESKFMLSYAYFSQKQFEQSLTGFNSLKKYNNKYTFAANYYAGYINYRNGDYDQALLDLKVAQQNEAYKAIVPFLIVNIYYRQGSYEELINYSENILKNDKGFQSVDEIYLLTAEAYFKNNEFEKSAEYFQKHVNEVRGKAVPEVVYRLAYSYFRNNDYDQAINNFKILAAKKDSLGQNSGYYLGICYVKTDNKPFALAAFDQGRKLTYNTQIQEEAAFQFCKLNYELEKYNDAISALKDFTKNFPSSKHTGEVNELMSESFLKSNNYAEAIKYIEGLKSKSLRINTAYQRIAYYKGIEEFNSKRFKDAIQSFDKAIQTAIDKDIVTAAYFWQAESYSIMRDYDNAIRSYIAVFQRPGNEKTIYNLKTRYGLGYAFYNSKQYDKAIPHFKEYVSKLENAEDKLFYNDALIRLADLYYVSKQYKEALANYNLAISKKNPDADYAWYQKGLVYSMEGNNEEAKNSFTTVIQQYPNSLFQTDAIFQRAQLNFQEGNYPVAISGFTKIIDTKGNSAYIPYAHLRRAIIHTNLNQNKEALKDYETIINNFPRHETAKEALRGIGQPLADLGRGEEINSYIEKVKAANPDVNTENIEYDAAYILYSHDKYAKAIEAFSKYLKSYPDGVNVDDAKFYLAESQFYSKDKEQALLLYKQIIRNKNSSYYNRALGRLADISFSNNQLKESKNYYRMLLAVSKNKKERTNAWLGLMETYYKLPSYDSSAFFAGEILKNGGGSIDSETKALLYLGKVSYAKKEFETAIEHFEATIKTAKDINAVEAKYLIAKIQYEKTQHKESLETLYDLNKSFSLSDEWLGKTFLLIADNLVEMNENFQAKATLNSIIERSPHKESVERAKRKLKEVEDKEKESEKDKETIDE